MSASPKKIGGRFTLVAKIIAKAGKEQDVAKYLNAVRLSAISDKEPNCYTYRVNQFANTFVIFEEYENPEALKFHSQQHDFQTWSKQIPNLVEGTPEVHFFKEQTSKL
ncbi:hypothetical protein SISSUDRAFT_1067464 [Sistotremastrum suecicum HHB10207 ss-3]|uniref:ABM domain-containing protein n=1 Tax=Sistotremastrum suecicum HHB10207 ss-3 TaxID=1314776 RepID=A0A165X391_9AGAM|nr:hypothetical protein SISSUDRAFT_1067464 [Sistotremastrum suecicum HHB10207 ss-3]